MGDDEIVTEEQTVQRKINSNTGHIVEESFLFNGELDCDHRPAYREFDKLSGRVTLERWMSGGKGHRWGVDKPCETVWDIGRDVIESESYMQLGNYHRENHRPARIWYSPETGNVIREEFWFDNQLHRENNLPAVVEYCSVTRKPTFQEFYRHGQKIRPFEPFPKP